MEVRVDQNQKDVISPPWEMKPLGDVAEVIMGQSPPGTTYNQHNDGTPLINGPTEFTDKFPIEIQWTTQPTKICQNGDLLLCVRGSSTGRMNLSNGKFCIGRGVAAIRAKTGSDTRFLTYQISSAIQDLLSLSAGSTFPNVDGKSIRSILIILPSLLEQRTIATALSDVDALITSLDQLIAKKHDIKQATMQELLTGKRRLPGFDSGNGFKETEVGMIPDDWVVSPLNDLVDQSRSIRYGIVQPGKYDPQGRFMIRGQDYSHGWVHPSELFKVSAQIEERYRNARVIAGDIIITIVGAGTGHVDIIPDWLDGANLTQTTARIAINQGKSDSKFCKFLLQSNCGNDQVAGYIKGAAQPGLNCGDLNKFQIPHPKHLAEQNAIATLISDVDSELAALELKRDKTKAIKQGMMQELLTGRIRLV